MKIRIASRLFLFLALFFLLQSGPAEGAVFCVSDSNGLQNALTAAQSNGENDTIQIVQGTYVGNYAYNSGDNFGLNIEGGYEVGCSSRNLTSGKTTLDAGGSGKALSIQGGPSLDFIVDGLTIQNANDSGLYVRVGGNFLLSNSIIQYNSSTYGGGAKLAAKRIDLLNNSFIYNAAGVGGAIDIQEIAEEINLINNLVSHNTANVAEGGGIHIKWGSPAVTFINNQISYNATIRNISGGHGGGSHISTYGPVNLINNTVVGNSTVLTGGWGAGTTIYYASSANIYNNIFWANEGQPGKNIAFYSIDPSTVTIIANNIDQASSGVSGLGTYDFDLSNIYNDPLFLSSANYDYHLQTSSPCINTGSNDAPNLPLIDKDGFPRVVGGIVDMGAYEYQGTIAPTAPDLYGWLREFHYYKLEERVVTKIEIKNRGTNSGLFKVSFYLSENGVELGEMICTGGPKKGLKANAVITQSCQYDSDTSLSGKYIIAVIDSDDQISEMVETNNRVKIRIP